MSARLHSPSALANPTLLFGLPSPHPASKFARPLNSALSSCTSSPSTHAHSSSNNNSSFHGQPFSIPPYSSGSSGASTSVSTSSSRNGSTTSSFSAASLASRYRPTPLPSPAIGEGVESPSAHEGNTPSFEYDSTSPALELPSGRPAPLSHKNSYASSVGASTDSSFSATQSPVHSTFDHSRASSSAIPPSPSPLSQDTTYQANTTIPSIPPRNNRPLSIDLSASSTTPPAVFTTSPLPFSTSLPSTVRPSLSRSQLSYSNKMKLLLQQKIDSVSKEVALKRAEANAKRLAEANSSHFAEETEGRHRTSGFDARREWTEGGRKEREKREKMEKAAREEASEREREREMRAVGGGWRKIGVL